MRRNRRLVDGIVYAGLIAAFIWSVLPMYLVLTTSVKVQTDAFSLTPKLLFFEFTWEHYKNVIGGVHQDFLRFFVNSIIVSIGSVIVALGVSIPAGYVLARFEFRGKRAFGIFLLLPRAIPPIAMLLPFFFLWTRLGLMDTLQGLVLIYVQLNLSIGVWMLREFIAEIPRELEEAALVDGCTRLQLIWRIVLPLAAPGIAATAILLLIFSWNEFLFAFSVAGAKARTAPVSVFNFVGVEEVLWGQLHAAGTMVVLPVILFALLVQRRMAAGLTAGAVTG